MANPGERMSGACRPASGGGGRRGHGGQYCPSCYASFMARLALFTQHETAAALGNRKQRQRLEGTTLARGKRIDAFGQTVIFYPEFAFAGLVAEKPSSAEQRLITVVQEACENLYRSDPFLTVAAAARSKLHKGWTLETVLTALVSDQIDALVALHVLINDVEAELAGNAISIRADTGQVLGIDGGRFTIALIGQETIEVLPINARNADIAPGNWISRQQIEFGSRAGQLLIPTVRPDGWPRRLRTLADKNTGGSRGEEALLPEMSAGATLDEVAETAVNPLARGVLAALRSGTVSPEMADVWGRGEDRVYDDIDTEWNMAEPDPTAALTHRRGDREDW